MPTTATIASDGLDFGRLVRESREALGWSRDQLGLRSELGYSRILCLETRPRRLPPQLAVVHRLCDVLDLDRDQALAALGWERAL